MSPSISTQPTPSLGALTSEQVERVRSALRSAAGEDAEALGGQELEERILPGLSGN